jgi:4-hydroxy-2-oxoglutarate aldolase
MKNTKKEIIQLAGVMPPITTPFRNGELAEDALKSNFAKWNRTHLSGYLVLGSNGEAVYLNEKEKFRVIAIAREAIPSDKIMLVGTGMESTRETISFTNKAAALGANLALIVTPSYFKGSMKPQVLYEHFITVAESAHMGILLYNVPQFTGINMEPDLVARLSEHPNIVGIKDSSGNIDQLSQIIHLSRDGFAVFVGSATVLFPALCVGAVGGVLAVANAVPDICTRIQDLYNERKFDGARKLQNRLTPLAKAVTATYGIGGLKIAMDLAGYFGGDPRPPLKRPGADVVDTLRNLLTQLHGT